MEYGIIEITQLGLAGIGSLTTILMTVIICNYKKHKVSNDTELDMKELEMTKVTKE